MNKAGKLSVIVGWSMCVEPQGSWKKDNYKQSMLWITTRLEYDDYVSVGIHPIRMHFCTTSSFNLQNLKKS